MKKIKHLIGKQILDFSIAYISFIKIKLWLFTEILFVWLCKLIKFIVKPNKTVFLPNINSEG